MIVRVKLSALRQSRRYEYVLRFALGGIATVAAGLVADRFGATVGGLFLAFPAIFFASATLIEKHERERKQQHGLMGARRGTDAAALEAAGAALGSLGLMTFAATIWSLAPALGNAALLLGAAVWCIVSVTLWQLRRVGRLHAPPSA
jgi:hypothetical protein